jgi:homoserine dehydrogenase
MNNINICIAGLGNVGSALVHIIEKNAKLVNLKSEININIIGLSAKNKTKKRNFNIEKYFWVDDPMQLLTIKGERPDVLIELIGYERAKRIVSVEEKLKSISSADLIQVRGRFGRKICNIDITIEALRFSRRDISIGQVF